jgi:hypothetical protein
MEFTRISRKPELASALLGMSASSPFPSALRLATLSPFCVSRHNDESAMAGRSYWGQHRVRQGQVHLSVTERAGLFKAHQATDALKGRGTDPLYLGEVFNVLEWTVCQTVLNDAPCVGRPDAW